MLRYLEAHKLKPGIEVKLVELAPFRGPVTLEQGGKRLAISFDLAAALLAQPIEAPQQAV